MKYDKEAQFIQIPRKDARIAYRKHDALASADASTVVFLGGYASDMNGTKAKALETFCKSRKMGFLCFDYRGHGESDGDFVDFGIGDWIDDAKLVVETLTKGPLIVIGSSMGGWIALKIAKAYPSRIRKLITIAAAPDFSEDFFWASFSEAEKAEIEAGRFVERPSGYEEPYKISPKLIEQGREHLVLREPMKLSMPVRLFQGMSDLSVSNEGALKLAEHIECDDLELHFIKGADHSFSQDDNLRLLFDEIVE